MPRLKQASLQAPASKSSALAGPIGWLALAMLVVSGCGSSEPNRTDADGGAIPAGPASSAEANAVDQTKAGISFPAIGLSCPQTITGVRGTPYALEAETLMGTEIDIEIRCIWSGADGTLRAARGLPDPQALGGLRDGWTWQNCADQCGIEDQYGTTRFAEQPSLAGFDYVVLYGTVRSSDPAMTTEAALLGTAGNRSCAASYYGPSGSPTKPESDVTTALRSLLAAVCGVGTAEPPGEQPDTPPVPVVDQEGPGEYGNPHAIETVACTEALQDQFGVDATGKRYFCFNSYWNIEPLD